MAPGLGLGTRLCQSLVSSQSRPQSIPWELSRNSGAAARSLELQESHSAVNLRDLTLTRQPPRLVNSDQWLEPASWVLGKALWEAGCSPLLFGPERRPSNFRWGKPDSWMEKPAVSGEQPLGRAARFCSFQRSFKKEEEERPQGMVSPLAHLDAFARLHATRHEGCGQPDGVASLSGAELVCWERGLGGHRSFSLLSTYYAPGQALCLA